MAPGARQILRFCAQSPVARRVLQLGAQAVAGVAAMVAPDARKIAGVRRRLFGAEHRAVVPAPASPFRMRRLLVASLLSLNVMSVGITPCVVSLFAAPVFSHDCCDPELMAAERANASPVIAGGPADCCVVAPEPLPPASVQLVPPPNDRVVVATWDLSSHAPILSSTHTRVIDPRARSAPRPPLVTVLLI